MPARSTGSWVAGPVRPPGEAGHQTALERIQEEFWRSCGRSGAPAGARAPTAVTPADLALHWYYQVEAERCRLGGPPISRMDKQVLAIRASQLVHEMDLTDSGSVSAPEWTHYMLMQQADIPSLKASVQVDAPLRAGMQRHPRLLEDLQRIFHAADTDAEGSLALGDVAEAYSRKQWHLCPSHQGGVISNSELDSWDPEVLAREVMAAMDLDGRDSISYAEFMVYCLGRRKHEVIVHFYDLSNGAAAALSPWLLGEKLEGLWHTGVEVFGQEYYFGGDILYDTPMETCFGEPLKQVSLGFTLWRQDEMHDFIIDELRPLFNRFRYDAISNNCNHFADQLCVWLTGKHLPPGVVQQPASLVRLPTVQMLRPLLNRWLGNRNLSMTMASEEDDPTNQQRAERTRAMGHLAPGTLVSIQLAEGNGSPILGMVCMPQALADVKLGLGKPPAVEEWVVVRFVALVPCTAERSSRAVVHTQRLPREQVVPTRFGSESPYPSALRAVLSADPREPRTCLSTVRPPTARSGTGATSGLRPTMSERPGSMFDDSPPASPPSTPQGCPWVCGNEEAVTDAMTAGVLTPCLDDLAVPVERKLCLEIRKNAAGAIHKVRNGPRAGICGRQPKAGVRDGPSLYRTRSCPQRRTIFSL